MRYDLHQQSGDDDGRIIYLGEIRRRRARKRSPDGYYLAAIALLAVLAWVTWAAVLFNLSPSRLLSYAGFLLPLWVALAATATVAASVADTYFRRYSGLPVAARRGLLTASVVVLNLAVGFAHRWGLLTLAVSVLLGVAVEVLQDRRHPYR